MNPSSVLFRKKNRPALLLVLGLAFAVYTPLAAAQQTKSPLFVEDPPYEDPLFVFRNDVIEKLKKELSQSLPRILPILGHETTRGEDPRVREALQSVLGSAKTASRERLPILLLVADFLAEKFWCDTRGTGDCRPLTEQDSSCKLSWKHNELAGGWFYQHNLLWLLREKYSRHPWGEIAFVLLLDRGWDTSGMCRNGADQFREVIRQGEAFLSGHPSSPLRAEVVFLVGQAYETWWSLSQVDPKTAEYANPELYRKGAPEAREKAIQYFEEVLKTVPAGKLATLSSKVLPLLRQGSSFEQGRFFCVYD